MVNLYLMFFLAGDISLVLMYASNVLSCLSETGLKPTGHSLYNHDFGQLRQQLLAQVSLMENTYQFCKWKSKLGFQLFQLWNFCLFFLSLFKVYTYLCVKTVSYHWDKYTWCILWNIVLCCITWNNLLNYELHYIVCM